MALVFNKFVLGFRLEYRPSPGRLKLCVKDRLPVEVKGPHIIEIEEAKKAEQQKQESWKEAHAKWKEARAKEDVLVKEFFQSKLPNDIDHKNYHFLIACGEKPLTHEEFAVRFIDLPWSRPPMFVRVSRHGKKWVLCRNAFTGDLFRRKTRYLKPDSDDVQLIVRLAESTNLKRLSEDEKTVGLDGYYWTLEIAQHGSYTYRCHWAPSCRKDEPGLAEFVDLCKHLETIALAVTGID